ncbi:neuralized-like protein 4 [Dysidea avara]|uniref:neuralized-like protein 4 n=1 Tax=Dysidea avara TaxID=196820 RepID=UPI00332C59E5
MGNTQPSQPLKARPPHECPYFCCCAELLKSLELPERYFTARYNMCYCEECSRRRKDKRFYPRADKQYGLPEGWTRFSLQLESYKLKYFDLWHRAYHGTTFKNVSSILENGLVVPGTYVGGGDSVSTRKGHFNDHFGPADFDTEQIFLSPSIKYVEMEAYSTTQTVRVNRKRYQAKVAFQALIRPDSYSVGPQTTGRKSPIDPPLPNSEMEWSTSDSDDIILYGILIKIIDY